MKIVVIEWDGEQPPTRFYNGLHKLNLRVRGDKEVDPMVRRSRRDDHSVVVQEGAILVESESLARQVAYLATECGARTVMVGNVDFPESERGRTMTLAEEEVVRRFNQAFRQRGRPKELDEESWIISCPECGEASRKRTDRIPIQCPHCGGLRVAARVGDFHLFDHYPTSLDEWKNMFFVEGYFEPPHILVGHMMAEQVKEINLSEEDRKVFEGICASDMIKRYLEPKLADVDMLTILSGVFLGRRYFTSEQRQMPRTEAVVFLLERGVNPSLIPLVERGEYDVLDGCVIRYNQNLILNFLRKV